MESTEGRLAEIETSNLIGCIWRCEEDVVDSVRVGARVDGGGVGMCIRQSGAQSQDWLKESFGLGPRLVTLVHPIQG